MGDEPPLVDPNEQVRTLVTEWESLQADIRALKRQSHRRIMGGIVVLAAVAGYGLQTSSRWLFAFIPIIIGVMFAVHVQESNHVYYRSWQCYRIEQRIGKLGIDAFDWTEQFGSITRSDKVVPTGWSWTRFELSPRQLPASAVYCVGLVTYLVFIIYTLGVVPTVLSEWLPWLPRAAIVGGLFLIYAVFTVLLVGIGATNWWIRLDFQTTESP